jgi:hypothetical protein
MHRPSSLSPLSLAATLVQAVQFGRFNLEACTNTSFWPSSHTTKPNPLSAFNHHRRLAAAIQAVLVTLSCCFCWDRSSATTQTQGPRNRIELQGLRIALARLN